jgi:hypothetical protein
MFEESRMLQVSIFETLQKSLVKSDFGILSNAATRSQLLVAKSSRHSS